MLIKKTKKGQATATLDQVLLDMRKAGESSLEMDVYETAGLCFRPMGILESLAGVRAEELKDCLVCKIGSYRWTRTAVHPQTPDVALTVSDSSGNPGGKENVG